MPLKKPSQLFQEERVFDAESQPSVVKTFNETFDKFIGNLTIVENLTEKVNQLTQEIEDKITRSDLENAMFSHLLIVDENIKSIDAKVKGLNKNDLLEFKRTSSHLIELVEDLSKNQFPKYKKKIVDTEIKISEKFNALKEEVFQNQETVENNFQEKLNNFAEVVDDNLSFFNENIQVTKQYVNETVETYKKLYKILESKTEKENQRLDEYSLVLDKFNDRFVIFQESIQRQIQDYEKINSILDEKFESFGNNLNEWKDNYKNDLDEFKKETLGDISSFKADIVVYESHNKSLSNKVDLFQENLDSLNQDFYKINEDVKEIVEVKNKQKEFNTELNETQKTLEVVERFIQNHHSDIEELKEEVYIEIDKLPFGNIQENIQRLENKIDFIRETYSKIEPEVIVKEVIKEGLSEPSSVKNSDPLTPLDKNFVTLDQLQKHYQLFINRIQQQLSTLGGGGETQLKYLDDVVGIATNPSAYDGKYLKYNHSLEKFELTSVDISSDSWDDGVNGPYTNASVGIGTSIPTTSLDVIGNARISGIITSTFSGNITGNINSSGINTASVLSGTTLTYTTGNLSTANINVGIITGQLNVSGISTLGVTTVTNLTSQNTNNSGITTTNSLSIGATQIISSARQLQNIASLDATTTATIESAIANAPNTFTDLSVTGISTLGVTSTTSLRSQQLNVSGISTFAGIATHTAPLFGTQASFTGIVTANTFSGQVNAGVGTITTLSGTTATYTTGNFTTGNILTGIVTSIRGTNLNYSGISTITNVRSATIVNTGVTTTNTLDIGTVSGFSTTITTVATTSATTIDSFAVAIYRSARVQVQITQSTNYQATDILVIHDGSVADLIEYGSIATNDYLGSFTATVSGGNCLLQINMNSATSATVKVLSQRITV